MSSSTALRFGVDDRVRYKTSARQWKKGIVIKTNYRESSWPEGELAPYQIKLDNGVLTYAPADSNSLIRAEDPFEDESSLLGSIHVCQAGPCRRAGGQAVLLEIEELANIVGGLNVQSSGCLGNCSQAPNALLVSDVDEKIFPSLCDLSGSAALVARASGRAPSLEDPAMVARLERARQLRMRMQAREESKWNLALSGMGEAVQNARSAEEREELMQEHAELLASAGYHSKALSMLASSTRMDKLSLHDIPRLGVLLLRTEVLAALGRVAELRELVAHIGQLDARGSSDENTRRQAVELLQHQERSYTADLASDGQRGQPKRRFPLAGRIKDYAPWRLQGTTPVSKHSAVYHFRSDEPLHLRGTPIRKGRRGRTVWSKTWHTTMLAQVGEGENNEGPLPWIERDYTPVSTAADWERGECNILIKVYLEPPGAATSWLHHIAVTTASDSADGEVGRGGGGGGGGSRDGGEGIEDVVEEDEAVRAGGQPIGAKPPPVVWLSRPMKTLNVPSLSAGDTSINRKHASVLLLVAGTGIVAIPQVLHHADRATCFGASIGLPPPVKEPVSVIYSCRRDDALLIPELAGYCHDQSIERCLVLVTAAAQSSHPPAFSNVANTDVAAAFAGLDNAVCAQDTRLSEVLLRGELELLQKPLRVVVSGPEGFNAAAKQMLNSLGVEPEAVTILSA
jgi:ferredoxin-NADP reductase